MVSVIVEKVNDHVQCGCRMCGFLWYGEFGESQCVNRAQYLVRSSLRPDRFAEVCASECLGTVVEWMVDLESQQRQLLALD